MALVRVGPFLIISVLVQAGPGFLKYARSWSGPRPGPPVRKQLVLARESLLWTKFQPKT